MPSDLLVAGVLALAAGGLAVHQSAPSPRPAPPLRIDAGLSVAAERLISSRGGVLVVPVRIDNRGPAVEVGDIAVWAAPVRADPATSGATRVPAADRRGFVVLVEPHCLVLGDGSPLSFVATVSVTLRTVDGAQAVVGLDIGGDPAVQELVARTCGPAEQQGV